MAGEERLWIAVTEAWMRNNPPVTVVEHGFIAL